MSKDEVPDELTHSLQRMSNLLLSEETVDAILEIVVTLARSTIPGADGAGVTVRRRGLTTAAHSDPMVTDLDDRQYTLGSGPCLSAIEDARRYRVESTAEETRWPEFMSEANASGIQSTWSFPLQVRGTAIGALNLYSRELHGFKEQDEGTADRFARQAATVLANAVEYESSTELSDQLRRAIENRQVTGEATGILMEREGCSRERAFGMLRRESNTRNVKLVEIAREIVEAAQQRGQ